jgi:hypothetical protein
MLIHPTTPIIFPILALVVLATEKILRTKGQPIFNPAALSIFITYWISVLFQSVGLVSESILISWWGVDMYQEFLSGIPFVNFLVPAALLFGVIYYSSLYKKSMLTGMFFMTVMGLVFFTNLSNTHSSDQTIAFLFASLFNAFAFMTFVMIPEPKSSASFVKQQAVVGVAGGLLFYFLTFMNTNIPNSFIMTVLGMNLLTYGLKRTKLLQN